jgi:hypothetical protein
MKPENYRPAEGDKSCATCAHFDPDLKDCVLWETPVEPDMLSDGYEKWVFEDLADEELTDEEKADVELGIGSRSGPIDNRTTGHLQARWPAGTIGHKPGTFMEMPDVLQEIERSGSVDLTPFVIAAEAKHVTEFKVAKTQNNDQLLAKVRVQAPHTAGISDEARRVANVGFFISKKSLGVGMIENVIRNLDVGDYVKGLAYAGIRKFARKSFYNPYKIVARLIRAQVRGPLPLLSEETKPMEIAELYCSAAPGTEEDGLFWKDALPVGTLALSPGYDGKPIHKPLRVVEGRSDDPANAIGLEDLVEAFEDAAIQHVTVPLSHADKPHENTGFVRKVRIGETKVRGKVVKALQCGIEFTDSVIRNKAHEGSIANVSVGVGFDYMRKDDAKRYPAVLKHLALTNKPWVPGMQPFGLSEDDSTIIPMFSESVVDQAPVKWDANRGLFGRREALVAQVEAMGEQYELLDYDGDQALVYDQEKGSASAVPYLITEGVLTLTVDAALPIEADIPGLVPSDSAGEAEGEEEQVDANVEAHSGDDSTSDAPDSTPGAQLKRAQDARDEQLRNSNTPEGGDKQMSETPVKILGLSEDEIKARLARADELEKTERTRSVDDRIEDLKALGLSETPGFLKKVRQLLLADNGGTSLVLSEDGNQRGLTVTQIVNELVDALPTKDGKVSLSEQHVDTGAPKPPVGDTDLSDDEKDKAAVEAARNFLAGTV